MSTPTESHLTEYICIMFDVAKKHGTSCEILNDINI